MKSTDLSALALCWALYWPLANGLSPGNPHSRTEYRRDTSSPESSRAPVVKMGFAITNDPTALPQDDTSPTQVKSLASGDLDKCGYPRLTDEVWKSGMRQEVTAWLVEQGEEFGKWTAEADNKRLTFQHYLAESWLNTKCEGPVCEVSPSLTLLRGANVDKESGVIATAAADLLCCRVSLVI